MRPLFLITMTALVSNALAQTAGADSQWFVKDGQNQPSLLQIYIDDIQEACYACYPEGFDDDIFIIYKDDGTHYNSRYDTGRLNGAIPDWSNLNGNGALHGFGDTIWEYDNSPTVSTDVNFNLLTNKTIEYLYWTNKYDEDDQPPINIVDGNDPDNPTNTIHYSYYPPQDLPLLTANHDIVHGKDITIIIEIPSSPGVDSFTLSYYNVITATGDIQTSQLNYLQPMNVFGNSFGYPSTVVLSDDQNIVKATSIGNTEYVYLNFRPTELLTSFVPSKQTFPQLEFTLTLYLRDSTIQVVQLREDIRAAHDPNFLKAVAFCNNKDGQYILYHGQFQNDGTTSANRITMDIELPLELSDRKVTMTNVVFSDIQNFNAFGFWQFGNKLSAKFNHPLPGCQSQQAARYGASVVSFAFCIGPFDDDPPLEDINYLVPNASVIFDNNPPVEMKISDEIAWTSFSSDITESKPDGNSVVKYRTSEDCDLCAKKNPGKTAKKIGNIKTINRSVQKLNEKGRI